MLGVLQTNWFADPLPPTLPIWLIALGLESMFIGIAVKSAKEMSLWSKLNQRQQVVGVFGIAFGYFFAALSIISTSYRLYSIYLFLVFRTLEGAAAVQIFRKIIAFFRSGTVSSNLKAKIRHKLVGFFILVIGLYLMFSVVTSGPIFESVWYDLTLIYTALVAILTFISVRWRLRKTKQEFNTAIVTGIAMGVAGAQIFGYTLVSDILITLAGGITYSIGFWVAAGFLLEGQLFGSSDSCPQCDEGLENHDSPSYCPNCGHQLS